MIEELDDDETTVIRYSWLLGNDSECDTCGWSFNQLVLEHIGDPNEWQLFTRVSCYGGIGVSTSQHDWDTRIEEIIEQAKTYEKFGTTEEKELRRVLDLVAPPKLF